VTFTYIKNGETLALEPASCSGCGMCIDVCPHGVFRIDEATARIDHRERCIECGACARNCPTGALTVRAGVGCASAVLSGLLRGTEPSCGCSAGKSCRTVAGGGVQARGSR
jgi:NAD-dependent dihydropyrimidine dehydrogenase PreA subunit